MTTNNKKNGWREKRNHAADFIYKCCPGAGSFKGTTEAHNLLLEFSKFLLSPNEKVYGGRRREHIAFAIELVARSAPARPEGAVATPYLIAQIEYSLRKMCEYVDGKGLLIKELPESLKKKGDKIGNRIYLKRLYEIFREKKGDLISQTLNDLDNKISSYTVVGGDNITSLGDRLSWFRNNALHGYDADIGVEGVFVGLLLLILYSGMTKVEEAW